MLALEAQVNVLASLITQLATVRDVSAGNLPVHLRSAITNVSSLAEELASSEVQEALAMADLEPNPRATDLQNSRRQINRNTKHAVAAPPAKRTSTRKQLYPPKAAGRFYGDLTRESLPAFIESFGRANQDVGISIWSQSDSGAGQNSTIRIVIPSVLVGYINLRDDRFQDKVLKPESVSVASTREQRTTSDFAVFRSISQHIFKVIAESKDITIPDLTSLLVSYRDLYSTACEKCKRICSSQDNTPATIHIWSETDNTQWIRRCYHDSCDNSS